jgi:hypothetical protein
MSWVLKVQWGLRVGVSRKHIEIREFSDVRFPFLAAASVKVTDSLLGYYAVSLEVYRRFRGIYCLLHQIVRMFGAVSTSDTSLNFTKLQYSRELSCSENFLFMSSLPCKWMLTFCFQISSPLPHDVTSIHILSSFSYRFYKRIRRIAWSIIELILIPFLKDECQMLAGNTL